MIIDQSRTKKKMIMEMRKTDNPFCRASDSERHIANTIALVAAATPPQVSREGHKKVY